MVGRSGSLFGGKVLQAFLIRCFGIQKFLFFYRSGVACNCCSRGTRTVLHISARQGLSENREPTICRHPPHPSRLSMFSFIIIVVLWDNLITSLFVKVVQRPCTSPSLWGPLMSVLSDASVESSRGVGRFYESECVLSLFTNSLKNILWL